MKAFAWSLVDLHDDLLDLRISHFTELGTLGEVAPDEPVDLFVAPSKCLTIGALEMLNFFKKKKNKKRDVAIEIAASLIWAQIKVGGSPDGEEVSERLSSSFALGYIVGLGESLLQSAGVEDQTEGMAGLSVIFMEIFGDKSGPSIAGQAFREEGNEEFDRARLLAHDEIVSFFENQGSPVWGLANYLLEEDDRR